jgi:hypothetical protein
VLFGSLVLHTLDDGATRLTETCIGNPNTFCRKYRPSRPALPLADGSPPVASTIRFYPSTTSPAHFRTSGGRDGGAPLRLARGRAFVLAGVEVEGALARSGGTIPL